MKVHIIVDSTVDLLPVYKEKTTVVPLTVHFGEEEYLDGVTITHRQFYEKLVETDVLPHTSQASPGDFEAAFEEVAAAGDSAVVITVSSSFSGTYQSAMIAARDFPGIYVVDSRSVAIGAGILAKMALEMAELGFDAEGIAATLEEEKKKIRIVALVDTLEYLKKGGRISKTVAFAGGVLNIKPVLAVTDGEILMLGKARGSRQGNNLLASEIEKAGGVDFERPLLLGYTGLSDVLLQKYVADSAWLWEGQVEELESTIIGSVIGTHVGPGAVAVAFFKKG